MSEIAKLYDEIMAGETSTEKVASDVNADAGPEFDGAFFEKVAAGDEEALGVLNEFIEEARAEGHSDEEIEEAVGEAMMATGTEDEAAVSEPEDDEFEQAKMSAYVEGSEQAITDVLESELAKQAGITAEDLVEFELGGHYGAGYAETRREAEEAIEKIAGIKEMGGKAKELGKKLLSKVTGGAKAYGRAMRGSGAGGLKGAMGMGAGGKRLAQVWGARLGTGAAAGGAGYLAHRKMKKGEK